MGALGEAIVCRVRFTILLGLFTAPLAVSVWHQHLIAIDHARFGDPNPMFSLIAGQSPCADDCTSSDPTDAEFCLHEPYPD